MRVDLSPCTGRGESNDQRFAQDAGAPFAKRTRRRAGHAGSAFHFDSPLRITALKKSLPRPREFAAALGFFLGGGTHRDSRSALSQRFRGFYFSFSKNPFTIL
jgi:hypothetical protein